MSARRLKDANNEQARYESTNNINGRPNRWPTLTTTQALSSRLTTAEEKARRSQVEYYKNVILDAACDDREKQRPQQTLNDDIVLTS
ncbi:unnamed protein product, partial [Rotaria magnacalcarata]